MFVGAHKMRPKNRADFVHTYLTPLCYPLWLTTSHATFTECDRILLDEAKMGKGAN